MIDFVSTHPFADQQTVACSRLLAAVIAQAIEDASSKHSSVSEQAAAIDWLFDKSSRFSSYAALIGLDAEAMRKALLTPIDEITFEPKQSKFDKSKRRILRVAHAKWLERRMAEKETLKRLNS